MAKELGPFKGTAAIARTVRETVRTDSRMPTDECTRARPRSVHTFGFDASAGVGGAVHRLVLVSTQSTWSTA